MLEGHEIPRDTPHDDADVALLLEHGNAEADVVDKLDGKVAAAAFLQFLLADLVAAFSAAILALALHIAVTAAVLLGVGFLVNTLGFLRTRTNPQARRVLRASLVYLPLLLALLLLDGLFDPVALALNP